MAKFTISPHPIDPNELKSGLITPGSGALTVFEGLVRDHNDGRTVVALEYEAFEALCVTEGDKIFNEASSRFGIIQARCVHRVGKLKIGDIAVWIGVTAAHRDEAFRACRYLIDEIKLRLPIWKKEYYDTGDSGWVNCEHCTGHKHNGQEYKPF